MTTKDDDDDAPLAGRARRALDDYVPPAVPRRLVDRVVAQAQTAPTRRGPGRRWLAASVLVGVAAAATLLLRSRPVPAPPPETHVAAVREALPLGDRGVATLAPGAALRGASATRAEQLAGSVGYEVTPRDDAFVLITPAGTITCREARFDVEVRPMKTGTKVAIAAGAGAAVALAVFVRSGRVEVASAKGSLDAGPGERVVVPADEAPRLAPSVTVAAAKRAPDPARDAQRASLLAAIGEARRRREAAAALPAAKRAGAGEEPAPPRASIDGGLDKAYVRTQVRALLPLLAGCYSDALRDEPTLAGDLVVRFTVTGEPGVGGLVTSSEIDPSSTIASAALSECVSETMYAIDLEPPEGGGETTIVYPFSFAPADEP